MSEKCNRHFSDIKFKMHHIAVLNDVCLTFLSKFTGLFNRSLRAELKQIVAVIDLGFYKTLLKISVNYARSLGCKSSVIKGPGPVLVRSGGKEGS